MREPWRERVISECLSAEFPGEWGNAPTNGGNATVLRATDMDDHGHVAIDGGARRTIPSSKLDAKKLQPRDILLESSGGGPGKPVGRVALFSGGDADAYICSNFFRTLRPNTGIVDAGFLAWRLQYFYRQPSIWLLQQQTTGIINLKYRDYLRVPIKLPPSLEAQQRIAEILGTVDEAIRKTEQIIAKLKQVKQGLLHDLLTRGIDDNGELRDPTHHPEQFTATKFGSLPRAWDIVPTGSLCSVVTKGTTPTGRAMWEGSDGIRFLRVDNLTFDGELDLEASRFRISTTTHTGALARSRCFPGDVLMNIVGPPLGKLGLVRPEFGDVNVNQAVAIFRPKPPLRSEYLLLWLTHDASQRWLRRNAKQTSGRVNLTLEMCKTLPLGQPRDSEQKEIVGRMAGIRGRLDTERMTCSKLRLLKQGLMEDLLTGRVRVTNLLGEAAA